MFTQGEYLKHITWKRLNMHNLTISSIQRICTFDLGGNIEFLRSRRSNANDIFHHFVLGSEAWNGVSTHKQYCLSEAKYHNVSRSMKSITLLHELKIFPLFSIMQSVKNIETDWSASSSTPLARWLQWFLFFAESTSRLRRPEVGTSCVSLGLFNWWHPKTRWYKEIKYLNPL